MAHTKAELAQVAARRAGLIRLRRQGVRYDDPRITGPDGLGYTSTRHASKDLVRALEEARNDQAAEASVYRQQENERLDSLLEAAWPQATQARPVLDKEGEVIDHEIDLKAVDTVLRLMDRRAKLNGLDMPVKAELSGPGGGAMQVGPVGLAELRNLIQTAGDPDLDDDPAGLDEESTDDGDDDSA